MAAPVAVEFEKRDDWGSAFIGQIKIKNRSGDEVKDWALEFSLDGTITSIWGAEVLSAKDGQYRLKPMDWSRQIRADQVITIGFIAEPGNSAGVKGISFSPIIAGDSPGGSVADSGDVSSEDVKVLPVYGGATDVSADLGDVGIVFKVIADWGSGYQAEMILRNNSSANVDGWEMSFVWPGQITRLWGARVVRVDGGRITVDSATGSWNSVIPVGGEVRFGFTGAPGGIVGGPRDMVFKRTNVGEGVSQSADQQVAKSTATPAPVILPAVDIDYVAALRGSMFFYDAQRSGRLPDGFRVEWRGDSALADGSDIGVDLSGGFYDAGDGMKFVFPMASALTLLAWGGIEFSDGYRDAGEMANLLATVRWGADWLMKAHFGREKFAVQVGRGDLDHAFWGPPEAMKMPRPTFVLDVDRPGTDAVAEVAAALAATAILFADVDEEFSRRSLKHAVELFDFADQYRGKYSDSIPEARAYYPSTGFVDELAWAAAWIARANGNAAMLGRAEGWYEDALKNGEWNGTLSWDDKRYGLLVLLAQMTGEKSLLEASARWLNRWTDGDVSTTPGGLAWLDQWGALRYAANTSLLAMIYSRLPGALQPEKYRNFAKRQIDYMLGDNPVRRSYVVGIGVNAPRNPHHRGSHGSTTQRIDDPSGNRNILYGALVGGPSAPRDDAYSDDRSNYLSNEVALDYNAGFTGAVAALIEAEESR